MNFCVCRKQFNETKNKKSLSSFPRNNMQWKEKTRDDWVSNKNASIQETHRQTIITSKSFIKFYTYNVCSVHDFHSFILISLPHTRSLVGVIKICLNIHKLSLFFGVFFHVYENIFLPFTWICITKYKMMMIIICYVHIHVFMFESWSGWW